MNDADQLDVEVTTVSCPDGEATIIRPIGEVDLSRSPSLRHHLASALRGCARLVVDLSKVPYMDSSGVATLVETMQAARRDGTTLVLCGLQDKVRSVFEIARLDTIFTIVATPDEGMKA